MCAKWIIPKGYSPRLSVMETEIAIKLIKDTFERRLAENLGLTRVSAPLFVGPDSGLNDNLNGVERPVRFDLLHFGCEVEIVQSLAKWKRMALKRYGFPPHSGLYADMNAIRRDEQPDNLHSVYVDQWDWERVITPEERCEKTLRETVHSIIAALRDTEQALCSAFPVYSPSVDPDVFFITTQELEDRYPNLTPKEREHAICREHHTVFLSQIGGALKSGAPHDGRAPDYDDWSLNGDILLYFPTLDISFEISSMGIRVDAQTLDHQLTISGCNDRRALPFHQMLLSGDLPQTIGGGIGQSRLCMFLLQSAHIGEVQASVWPKDMVSACEAAGIHLL